MRSVLAAIVAASLAGGCDDGRVDPDESHACGRVISTVTIRDKFEQTASIFVTGEPITFAMQITNRGLQPQRLNGALSQNGCALVDIAVQDSTKQTIWGAADGIWCVTVPTAELAPGEVKVMAANWLQLTRGGSQAPPGDYTAHGRTGVEIDGRLCELHETAEFAIR